jgi:hypothetical protein
MIYPFALVKKCNDYISDTVRTVDYGHEDVIALSDNLVPVDIDLDYI